MNITAQVGQLADNAVIHICPQRSLLNRRHTFSHFFHIIDFNFRENGNGFKTEDLLLFRFRNIVKVKN